MWLILLVIPTPVNTRVPSFLILPRAFRKTCFYPTV